MSGSGHVGWPVWSTLTHNTIPIPVSGAGDHFLREPFPSTHAPLHPLGKETDYRFFMEAVPGWMSQVQNLLQCHKVYLYHRPEEFYLIKMFGDVDGELVWIRFKTTAEGKTKCGWPDCVPSGARQYCEYIRRPWRECQLPEMEPEQTEGKGMADQFDGPEPGD